MTAENPKVPTIGRNRLGIIVGISTAPSGFQAKPVNSQLHSHSVSTHSAAKARMKGHVAPARAGAALSPFAGAQNVCTPHAPHRSDRRHVGKEGVGQGSSRWPA